jgi:Tol biopolymer transport system component
MTDTSIPATAGILVASVLVAPAAARVPQGAGAVPCSPGAIALERVSLDELGGQTFTCQATDGTCKNNSHPTLSADGLRVAWESDANGVVLTYPNPTNRSQIYLRDVAAGTTRIISIADPTAPAPLAPGDGASSFAFVSPSGRYVAFTSAAGNLDPNDGDGYVDAFVHDTLTVSTWRVSENRGGVDFDGDSGGVALSYDAEVVAFQSNATDVRALVRPGRRGRTQIPLDPGVQFNVFVQDAGRLGFEWISAPVQAALPDGDSWKPSITYDGRFVAFQSDATNLTALADLNDATDVFVRDRVNGKLTAVSVTYDGQLAADAPSTKPFVAGLGRYVVFESGASNLLAPGWDTGGRIDVFVRDLALARTVRVSVDSSGAEANDNSGYGGISADGRFVVFSSLASNLVAGDTTNGFLDFFVHDRDRSGNGVFDEPGDICTRRLSETPGPSPVGATAISGGNCAVSFDGRYAVFMTHAENLVTNDVNGVGPYSCSPKCIFGRDVLRATIF